MPSPDPSSSSSSSSDELGHGLEYSNEGPNYSACLAVSSAPALKRSVAHPGARRRVVEHGAGTGSLSRLLLDRGVRPLALTEPDPKLAGMLRADFADHQEVEVAHATLEGYLDKVGPGSADAIVSSNVLEHVVDDEACL